MNPQSPSRGTNQIVQVQQLPPHAQVTSGSGVSSKERYKHVLFGLGVTEVVLGSLSVFLGIVALIIAGSNQGYYEYSYSSWSSSSSYYRRYHHYLTYSSQGIWCGIFLVVTGFLGIRAKSDPTTCIYNANMAMSIITANMTATLTILSGIAAAVTGHHLPSLVGMHSVLCVLGFAAMIISIIHSAYCCAGVCCRTKEYRGTVSYFPQQVTQPQMVQLANGQYMMVQTQSNDTQYTAPVMHVDPGTVAFQPPQSSVATVQMPATQHIYPTPNPQPVQPATLGQQNVTTSSSHFQPAIPDKNEQQACGNPPGYNT